MKALLTALTLGLLCALPLLADSPKAPKPAHDRGAESRMLHHLLKMQPEELAALRQTIERIERMTPEEKAQLRVRLGTLERMPPERIEAMRERFEAIDPETREAMRQRWMAMTPEARREWRQKLRAMSQEERSKVFEEQGFLPAPGKRPKEDKPPQTEDE